MTKHDDGGPMFPHPSLWQGPAPEPPDDLTKGAKVVYRFGSPGVSLHDWYAGQALAGLVNFGYTDSWDDNDDKAAIMEIGDEEVRSARHAYILADAMIAEKRRREAEK